jgi:hypothetical protein
MATVFCGGPTIPPHPETPWFHAYRQTDTFGLPRMAFSII